MRFFAQTVFQHIRRQIERHIQRREIGNKLLFMLPSIPVTAAAEIGNKIVEYCSEHERLLPPLIRIASELFAEWEATRDTVTSKQLEEMLEKGWRDERGNLTSYRNTTVEQNGLLVVVLVGVDKVTDASSLADFHHCDLRTIWETELGHSFEAWVRVALTDASVGFEEDTVEHFNCILSPLVERGLADILQISTLLETLDLSVAQDGRDAEDILLRSLGRFGLPSFAGYRFSSRRSFGQYIEDAISFFSYDAFLEDRARQKALKTIDKFIEHTELGEVFDENYREPFASDEEFVEGLRLYIGSGDTTIREKLRQCDFVTIRDRILKFRAPREPKPKKETVKKLTGGPIEVVLTGLWNTLAEFKKEAIARGVFAHEVLKEIRIDSRLFKHDCDGESSDERTRKALAYLSRLLGGVDRLIEKWIDLAKLCGEGQNVLLRSRLVREDIGDDFRVEPARNAEPFLQFSVELIGEDWERPIVKQFAWRLPEIEPYRIADELLQWAADGIKKVQGKAKDAYCLPVYHVPYYEELMLAKDDEESRRVLLQCIKDESDCVFNLLYVQDVDKHDPLLRHIQKLAFEYDHFIQKARSTGLYAALGDKWDSLRKAYEQACDAYLRDHDCKSSPLASLIFRSFLIIQQRHSAEGNRWVWDEFEPSSVITILHPALLEMLQAHVLYLLACFNTVAGRELRAPGTSAFREAVWRNYVDLSAIQMPLCGLLKDRNKILDTDVRGENLIHRIGNIGDTEASLTTRMLLRYDTFEEESVSDAELFRKSRESMLIYRILRDYQRLHPHADDGLSIAIYQNQDIQPLIAAVDQFLSEICKERHAHHRKYAMSVTVFTESSDDTSVARWINQWKERWEAAETQGSLAHYRKSRLSVAHRIVSPSNYYQQFRELIRRGLEVDIVILNGFIGAGAEGNDFQLVEPYDVTTRTLKFPILQKSFCALRDPGKQLQRARILSNRQFSIATRHAEVMARLKSPGTPQNTHHVVLGFGDYTPWQGVVDELHRRAEWVVCIDPNIDERLIVLKGRDTQEAREIIGFGSGVGSHGEANYTISTEQFRLSDVLQRLKASISEIFSGWTAEVYETVANSVLAEARRLSGLSLVRATGVGQYIRDFMAYALTRKILTAEGEVLCDQIISLDAYRHWFDSADSDTRPDLLWVVARVGNDGRIHLDLRLVECKLAKMSDVHLDKARQQLENGLRHLISVFMPRRDQLEDDRPDQRYWWLQLHRLIASKAEIASREQGRVLTALERLAEGDYDVEWRAAAISFWTDQSTAHLSLHDTWTCSFEGEALRISVVCAGKDYIRALCTASAMDAMPWAEGCIRFESVVRESSIAEDEEHDQDDEGSSGAMTTEVVSKHVKVLGGSTDLLEGEKREERGATSKVKIPDRILLGMTSSGSRRIYWEFGHKELNNRHMLLFGTSGMGKTYTIQCLLYELGRYGQNSLIVDYTNGFFDNQLEDEFRALLRPVQHIVRRDPIPINPFRQQVEIIGGGSILEGVANTAQRVSGVFAEVYRFGDQQKSALYQAVKQGIRRAGDSGMLLEDLIPCLEELAKERGAIGTAAGSVISKIRPFVDQNPFGAEDPESWERLFTDPQHRCHILQLAGFLRDSARLITEFSLIDLYWFYRGRGTFDCPRVLVLDEVQNLDHREESPLAQLLREGRKFGFSLILATQIMSNLEKDERDRLFNAAHKLFFRPADTEIRTYADIAAVSTGETTNVWMKRLASLRKGECYSLGPSLNEVTGKLELKAFRIKITALAERGRDD